MTRTRALALSLSLQLCLLAGLVALLLFAHAASATDCVGSDPCGAEPAPLPRLYLPSVQRSMPPMAAEYTPAQPSATPEPDVELPLGDASQ